MSEAFVFEYEVRGQKRYADPDGTHRAITRELGGKVAETYADAKSEDDGTAFPAIERLLAAGRVAFGLHPIDPTTGQGYAEREVFDVLDQFGKWVQAEKKTPDARPTSAPPTGPGSSPSTHAASSDCGCTSRE